MGSTGWPKTKETKNIRFNNEQHGFNGPFSLLQNMYLVESFYS